MHVPGRAWGFADGGLLDLGIIRDTTLSQVNQFQTFYESRESGRAVHPDQPLDHVAVLLRRRLPGRHRRSASANRKARKDTAALLGRGDVGGVSRLVLGRETHPKSA
jgi:hypothetical protein